MVTKNMMKFYQTQLFENDDDDGVTNDPVVKPRDGSECWSNKPIASNRSRITAKNILRKKPGPTRFAVRMSSSITDCFTLFFRTSPFQETCKWTNKEGNLVVLGKWRNVTVVEIKKVLGSLGLIGVFKCNYKDISQLGSPTDGGEFSKKSLALIVFKRWYGCYVLTMLENSASLDRQTNYNLLRACFTNRTSH